MSCSLLVLSHANRTLFLKDFLESFEAHARKDTELILCLQGCVSQSIDLARNFRYTHKVTIDVEEINEGLNRYDNLVEMSRGSVLIDCDEDSLLPQDFESVFEKVLAHPEYGWIGYYPEGSSILRMGKDEWLVEGEKVLASAVDGGLAATRRATWLEVGGFGVGSTKFDLENARYERKCLAKGFRCGVLENRTYVHHGNWAWHIQYGTWLSRLDSLHEALLAKVISVENYRSMCMEYCNALEAYVTREGTANHSPAQSGTHLQGGGSPTQSV